MIVRPLPSQSNMLLVVLATVVALGPLSIDMYLPAMPGMVDWFGTSVSQVQLTISSFLVGFALFHLVCGPLADRYGRKPVMLGGLGLYLVAGVACANAQTIGELIFFRFLQGVAACVGPTLGRAITRDLFEPQQAARALAYIAIIMALAPAAAPTVGGILLVFYDWPSIFYALSIYCALAMILMLVLVPESLPEVQSLHPLQIGRNYLSLFRDREYLQIVSSSSLLYAGMITFLSVSGFVLIDMQGVSPQLFGLLFLPIVVGYMIGNALSTRLSVGRTSERVMWIGVNTALCAAALMFSASSIWFHPASIVIPMAGYAVGCGLVLPHAMAVALRAYPHMAATASALLGFIQMGLSSAAGAFVGYLLVDTALPMTLNMCALAIMSWLLIRPLRHP